GGAALGFEHLCDVARGAVTEKLPERFLMVGNLVLLNEGKEVLRGVACQGGLCKMRISGKKILWSRVNVRKIATSATGDEDFLSDLFRTFEHSYTPAALSSFNRAHQSCRTSSQYYCVELSAHRRSNCLSLSLRVVTLSAW